MRHTRRHRDSYFSVIMTLLWNASGKKNKGQGLTEKFFFLPDYGAFHY